MQNRIVRQDFGELSRAAHDGERSRTIRDYIAAGIIVGVVIAVVFLQLGMRHGRDLEAEASARAPEQIAINLLNSQLNNARFDLEVEREKLSIILCESGAIHHEVWGDGGKSYGIAQFQHRTFNDLRVRAGRPELQWKRRDDQLWLLDWALRHGYGKYWTCFGKTDPSAPPLTKGRLGGVREAKR